MKERLTYQIAALAGIAGAILLTIFGFPAIRQAAIRAAGKRPSMVPVLHANATTQPAPLNKREQLFARMKMPVAMPPDLVATIATKDPELSKWVDAWQKDHLGVERRDREWLAPVLVKTPLAAGDLWRLCRQVDRGGVSDACRYIAAASVRRAKDEVDHGTVRVDASYVDELTKLQPFLEHGAWQDPQAMEIWAQLILTAPARTRTTDMCDSARLGLAWAKYTKGNVAEASGLLNQFKTETTSLSRPQQLSDANQNELNYFLGNVALKQGHYAEALSDYEAVPHVDSDDAIYAMEYSSLALAHLGRIDDAKHRLAEFLVRYHFDEGLDGRFTEVWGDQLATDLTRIASGKQSVMFSGF